MQGCCVLGNESEEHCLKDCSCHLLALPLFFCAVKITLDRSGPYLHHARCVLHDATKPL